MADPLTEAPAVVTDGIDAPAVLRSRRLELWLPILIVAFDQLTKAIIRSTIPLYSSVTVIPGLLNLTHVLNSGAAFGILNTADFAFKTVVIAIVQTSALIGVGLYAASLAHHQLVARTAFALIIGGAAGNLVDRIVAGSVVDFVDVYWRTHHFWAFNVADSAITIGVVVMILDTLGAGARVSKTD
jgi:signal peptidase II